MQQWRAAMLLQFQVLGTRRVVDEFDGGTLTSDAGALLLRELDGRRRGRLLLMWMPPITWFMGIRRGGFFTATATAIAICRSTSSAKTACRLPA